MEDLGCRLSCLFCFFGCFFLRLLFLLSSDLVRKTLLFPGGLKDVLQGFSLDRRDKFFDFGQKLKFLGFFICVFNVLVDYFQDLFVGQFDADSALLGDLLESSSTFQFPSLDVFDGKVQMIGVVYGSCPYPRAEGFTEVLGSDGELGRDGVEHIADLLLGLLEGTILDGVEEVLLGCGLRLEEVGDEPLAQVEVLGDCLDVLILSLHVDKLKQLI